MDTYHDLTPEQFRRFPLWLHFLEDKPPISDDDEGWHDKTWDQLAARFLVDWISWTAEDWEQLEQRPFLECSTPSGKPT